MILVESRENNKKNNCDILGFYLGPRQIDIIFGVEEYNS